MIKKIKIQLHDSCEKCSLHIVEYLLSKGAYIETKDIQLLYNNNYNKLC